jgi:hypothetical protein
MARQQDKATKRGHVNATVNRAKRGATRGASTAGTLQKARRQAACRAVRAAERAVEGDEQGGGGRGRVGEGADCCAAAINMPRGLLPPLTQLAKVTTRHKQRSKVRSCWWQLPGQPEQQELWGRWRQAMACDGRTGVEAWLKQTAKGKREPKKACANDYKGRKPTAYYYFRLSWVCVALRCVLRGPCTYF